MSKDDKEKVRQMMQDILSGHTHEVIGRFNVIHANLVQIKEQTTKTNGKVSKLETDVKTLYENDIKHALNCPFASRVEELEKSEISRKSVLKFVGVTIVATGTIVGIVTAILDYILK